MTNLDHLTAAVRVWTSSELFAALCISLRRDGCVLNDLPDHEVATAISESLDFSTDRLSIDEEDAETLARAFESIAETLGA